MASIKTKYTNKLVVDNGMSYCLSSTLPRFDRLIEKNPYQPPFHYIFNGYLNSKCDVIFVLFYY